MWARGSFQVEKRGGFEWQIPRNAYFLGFVKCTKIVVDLIVEFHISLRVFET
jgi:hypothetical protein